MKKIVAHFILMVTILAGSLGIYLFSPLLISPFESRIKDMMLQFRGETKGDPSIVIVDIDEKSLSQLGQWPWSRDKVATILQNLTQNGVGIIGLDVVFAEPDNSSPKKVLASLGMNTNGVPDHDEILASTIAQTPTIVGYVFAMEKDGVKPLAPPKSAAIIVSKNQEGSSILPTPYRPILNLDVIQDNAYSNGYFNTVPDPDGVVRSVPMVMNYNEMVYPSLTLEMIRVALQEKRITVDYDPQGVEAIYLGEKRIPTDQFGRLLVNYAGASHSYTYLSAADVYYNKVPKEKLEGKIVMVGTSAAGLLDLRSTPFDSTYPGVEVHANVLDNLINDKFLARPSWALGADVVTIIVSVLLTFVILLIPSPLLGFGALSLLVGGIVTGHYHLMLSDGILLQTLTPLAAITLLYLFGVVVNYFFETRQKEAIKKKFAAKVSPAVMEDLLKSGKEDVFAAHEREITVSFSDVRNFTNISESLHNPKTLIALMNAYMDPMTELIIKSGGTVDKFIGDAIMAYWNAPADVPNHADAAVEATLYQLHALRELNVKIKADERFANMVKMSEDNGVEPIDIGIGLNTGVAIVGEMGSSSRSDYTVIGDPINLGARLESLCKFYNSKCNISNFVKERLVESKYIFRFLDLVTVKGKKEPIEIWQIHDFTEGYEGYFLFNVSLERLREELELYHRAITLYKGANFVEALAIFQDIESWKDKTNKYIYKMYIERCEHYIEHPPVDFNGVFVHTTKG